MSSRLIRGAAATGLLVPLLLVTSSSAALAVNRDDGDQPGPGMPYGEAFLVYVGIPVALFLVIALLVYAPSMGRGPRYRPGLSWWAAPVWFNGPDNPEDAVSSVRTVEAGGGASARW